MHPTSFRWTRTVAVFLTSFYITLLHAQGVYDAGDRRLKITPKDCSSLKYPNTIGICMFNLECKEKEGTVIGACVDRFLFGACCYFPGIEVTTTQNLTSSTEGIFSTTFHLGSESIKPNPIPNDDATTTPKSTPLDVTRPLPIYNPSDHYPEHGNSPPPSHTQTMDPLPAPLFPNTFGDISSLPLSIEFTTLLPIALETVTNGSDSLALRPSGVSLHHLTPSSRLPLPLEYATLKPKVSTFKPNEESTEEPPRLSTFMYVNDDESGSDSQPIPNPFETSTRNTFLSGGESTTTLETPALSDSGTESVWSIVHQLVPSGPHPLIPPSPELQLNSDELYHILSETEPVGSVMENKIQVIPPLSHTPVNSIWKMTPPPFVSETTRPSTFTSVPPPPRPLTNRPWASSTYQIHTFRYPVMDLTTPFPGGGELITWGGVVENVNRVERTTTRIHSSFTERTTPSTTTTIRSKPSSIPMATVRTTTIPVAEVTGFSTVPTSTLTTERVTLTTSTTTPTTITTTTTPPPSTPPPTTTTPLPKKKPIEKVKQVTTLKPNPMTPPKTPMDPQPGILQSEFDSNIDDFVNQVVQNLAGSLDNLDLDEVILSPSPSSVAPKDDTPPTLHPLHVLSDPLFPPFPVIGQVPLIKPEKTGAGGSGGLKIPPLKKVTTTTTARPLDYRRDCGVRPLNKQGRIVGGSPSKFGRWPWQALVREATWLGLFSKNKCGGVLISPKYVLTAAHCQPGFLATLTVVLGDFDISSETEGSGGNSKNSNSLTKNVRRVIVHRDYNAQTFENDIALLELESAVEYQQHIVPICMPMDNEVNVGQQAFVTGWGRLKYGGSVPNTLHEVDVPILNNSDCQNMFLKSGHIKAIRESFICAGYANGAKDSCEGDSGGPLAMMRPNGQWMLAGTVSHGIKCAYPNLPGVYMRMTYYKPWIKRVTGVTT